MAGSVADSAARGELVEARRDEYGDSGDGSDGSDGSDEPEAKMRARPTCLPGPSRLKVLSQCWLPYKKGRFLERVSVQCCRHFQRCNDRPF